MKTFLNRVVSIQIIISIKYYFFKNVRKYIICFALRCKLLTINLFVVAVTVTERYATFYTSKDFTPIYHGKRGFPRGCCRNTYFRVFSSRSIKKKKCIDHFDNIIILSCILLYIIKILTKHLSSNTY